VFITVKGRIMASQIFPFFYYQRQLWERWGISFEEIPLERFLANPRRFTGPADTVCVQTWFDLTPVQTDELAATIRRTFLGARLVYLDWFAPTDLRLAEQLEPVIDLYIKKHIFRDLRAYGVATYGDTNLVDHFGKHFDLQHEERLYPVSEAFLDKLMLGPTFNTSPRLWPGLSRSVPRQGDRPIDLHARLGSRPTEDGWYSHMRGEAVEKVRSLRGLNVAHGGFVSSFRFLRELAMCKVCFSPFGFGEVCWRDYEAVMSGALLLKPDMSAVETRPDIFVAGETYVSLEWDLSDFEEKLSFYLEHRDEREAISRRAFEVLRDYVRQDGFLEQMAPLFEPGTFAAMRKPEPS
jgi:hypothetical protein